MEIGYNQHLMRDEEHLPLTWESSYEIVQQLKATYPTIALDTIGTKQLLKMIAALPDFADDVSLASEALLIDILREWYEETL